MEKNMDLLFHSNMEINKKCTHFMRVVNVNWVIMYVTVSLRQGGKIVCICFNKTEDPDSKETLDSKRWL